VTTSRARKLAHQGEAREHRVAAAQANPDVAGGERAHHAAHCPGDEADPHVLWPAAETLGAVQDVPAREALEVRTGRKPRPRRCPVAMVEEIWPFPRGLWAGLRAHARFSR
jgi:hypothetical protein